MPTSALLNAERPTPELALVDDQLAVAARSTLPEVDTLAQIELLVRAHRIAVSRSADRTEPPTTAPAPAPVPALAPAPTPAPAATPARAPTRGRRLGGRRRLVVGGGVAAAVLVSALLIGVRVDVGGQRAGADTAPTERPPVVRTEPVPVPKTPAAKPSHVTSKAPPAPPHVASKPRTTTKTATKPDVQPRRFVWAPVPRATAYRVQFFRGSRLVFDATTKKPEMTVPQHWTFAGSRRSLSPGAYRWNVWPITAAGQDPRAAVQARLVVGR